MLEDQLVDARALHGNKRRWLTIVGGNAAVLVLMLGVPWLRGYLRTRTLWRSYAAYGACLFGGQPSAEPGLGLPPGHEAYFATRAVREPGWAAKCDDVLSQLAPPEVTFVLPAVKVAEADLRAAVKLLRAELLPLSARTPGTRLSVRPLRAFERLRAGLANHTRASGAVEVPEGSAFSIPSSTAVLPTPARLPLYAGAHALLSLWGSDAELYALATDHTGISYVHVQGGQLTQTRISRPKLLEAALPRAQPTSFVWAMARARCIEREHGCADKALGVARVSYPVEHMPTPRWLGAHPSGRLDRSLWRDDARVVVAAQTAQGTTEVREFALDRESEASAQADAPPLAPSKVWSTRAPGDPLLLSRPEGPRVLLAARTDEALTLSELTPDALTTIATLPGAGAPWAVACQQGETVQLAFGHEHALVVRRGEEQFAPVPVELHEVIDARDAAYDRVRPLCESGGTLVHDARDRLLLISCEAGTPQCKSELVAADVHGFAALVHNERLIVAYAGVGESSQVRVRSISMRGNDAAEEQVPAVCWSDSRGLCGTPTLARVGERILLGAREGTDLRVLESGDAGLTWIPLKGLARRD
ncbi:MAG TPA: hypothetical protein VI299_13575 [Polyangiales bacterium]